MHRDSQLTRDSYGRSFEANPFSQREPHVRNVLSAAHATRIDRGELVIEARVESLVFGDQLRIEAARLIAQHLDLDPSPSVVTALRP